MEPMEVLHEIVAADKKAREAYDRALRRSQNLDGALNRLRGKLEAEAMDRAKRDVDEARTKALAEAQSAMDALEEQYRRELASLEERFQARREETVERMFRIVVGLDD